MVKFEKSISEYSSYTENEFFKNLSYKFEINRIHANEFLRMKDLELIGVFVKHKISFDLYKLNKNYIIASPSGYYILYCIEEDIFNFMKNTLRCVYKKRSD